MTRIDPLRWGWDRRIAAALVLGEAQFLALACIQAWMQAHH